MLKTVKSKKRNRYILKNLPDRKKNFCSLIDATSIGAIFSISCETEYHELMNFHAKLQQMNKDIHSIVYLDQKNVPIYCQQWFMTSYFSNNELNWFGVPKDFHVKSFIKNSYDIIIDFTKNNFNSIDLIIRLSNSKFIIGANKNFKSFYDLFFDINNCNNDSLLNNIERYSNIFSNR